MLDAELKAQNIEIIILNMQGKNKKNIMKQIKIRQWNTTRYIIQNMLIVMYVEQPSQENNV